MCARVSSKEIELVRVPVERYYGRKVASEWALQRGKNKRVMRVSNSPRRVKVCGVTQVR